MNLKVQRRFFIEPNCQIIELIHQIRLSLVSNFCIVNYIFKDKPKQ